MKPPTIATLFLGSMLFASTLPASANAADLSPLVAEVTKWESGQNAEPLRQIEQLARESAGQGAQRAELEAALVKLLAPASTFEARRFACQQLAVAGSDASVPAIAKLLQDNETIGLAGLAFGNRPSAKADQALRAALPASSGPGRLQIISTLGNRRDAKAVKPLATLARDADVAVAQTAIQALGKIANQSAREVVTALRNEANPALERALAAALLRGAGELAKSGNRQAAAVIYEKVIAPTQPAFVRRGAFAALLRCERDGGEQRILQTLRSGDAVLKPVAIAAVRHLPSQTASAKFGRELPRLAVEEQVWLIDSLAARPDAAARAALVTALASADTTVRQAAAQALGRIGEVGNAKPLAKALAAAKDEAEANAIIAALAGLPGGRDTDNAVLAELNAAQGKVRAQLISSLATRGRPEVLAALLSETEHPDPTVAKAAYRVLARAVTAESLPKLLAKFNAIRNAERRADAEMFLERAVLAVEKPGDRSAAVRAALPGAANLETRLALLRLLPACGDASALATVKTAKSDANARVREVAVAALADWPDASAWDTLAGIYRQPESDAQRRTALRGLVGLMSEAGMSSQEQTDRYHDLLAGVRGDAELKLILGAMGGAQNAGVLKLALPLLDQPGVRAEAEVAVKKMAEAIKDQNPEAAKEALDRLAK